MSNNSIQSSLVPVLTQKEAHVKNNNKKCCSVTINIHACLCIKKYIKTINVQALLHIPETLGNIKHHMSHHWTLAKRGSKVTEKERTTTGKHLIRPSNRQQ